MSAFDKAFAQTVGNEGGYSSDPRDPGGETKFGISKRAYPNIDIKTLTLDEAKFLYKRDYWERLYCDRLHPSVADDLFDIAVNHGVHAAALVLQKIVGAVEDGVIGQATIAAANAKDPDKIVMGLISLRIMRYTMDRNWGAFGKGWANRAARMLWRQSQEATS